MTARSFAIYGKGGSGKSTIAAALSSAFADLGLRVLHIGCDPKADSSRPLLRRGRVRSVMGEAMTTRLLDASSVLVRGVKGITCVEAGGPEPGVGCAGRGISRTFELLAELGVSLASYDVVVYDVLGDVVCGGFAVPMREGHARYVAVTVSGTGMSLFAANNILRAVRRFHRNGVRLAGLIGNYHTGEAFRDRVPRFAAATGTSVLVEIPFDPQVQKAEERRATILDWRPQGATARAVRRLASRLLDLDDPPPPKPLEAEAFERFLARPRKRRRTAR
ncbi:MAG: nitrogenase iron protein [Myxococcales bacterium]|nr:nitrogenase iron protein [Myxococcales bacterium]